MRMTENAKPESIAADKTSVTREGQHQERSFRVCIGGQTRTIVLDPPRKVFPPNVVIEDEANDRPRDIVDRIRGRNRS